MPVYDCDNEETIRAVFPSRVFDANGVEIEYVRWCDTDTGRVMREVWNSSTSPQLTPDKTEILTVWETHPAPLRLVKIGGPAEPVAAPAVRPPEGNDGCAVAVFGLMIVLAALAYSWPVLFRG